MHLVLQLTHTHTHRGTLITLIHTLPTYPIFFCTELSLAGSWAGDKRPNGKGWTVRRSLFPMTQPYHRGWNLEKLGGGELRLAKGVGEELSCEGCGPGLPQSVYREAEKSGDRPTSKRDAGVGRRLPRGILSLYRTKSSWEQELGRVVPDPQGLSYLKSEPRP